MSLKLATPTFPRAVSSALTTLLSAASSETDGAADNSVRDSSDSMNEAMMTILTF